MESFLRPSALVTFLFATAISVQGAMLPAIIAERSANSSAVPVNKLSSNTGCVQAHCYADEEAFNFGGTNSISVQIYHNQEYLFLLTADGDYETPFSWEGVTDVHGYQWGFTVPADCQGHMSYLNNFQRSYGSYSLDQGDYHTTGEKDSVPGCGGAGESEFCDKQDEFEGTFLDYPNCNGFTNPHNCDYKSTCTGIYPGKPVMNSNGVQSKPS